MSIKQSRGKSSGLLKEEDSVGRQKKTKQTHKHLKLAHFFHVWEMQNVKTMPKQLPNPLGRLISPSFQFLAGELRYSVATSTSSPGWCAGDLTGAKQAKSSKVRRPKCLRRQSLEVPPSAWA